MNHEQTKRETWQEVLMRVLDTHISRRNAPNIPLNLTLPYDAVVALKGLMEREYGGTEARAEFGKGSETTFARLDGDRRLFEVKMTHNGRTVTISYDPSDPEAVKAAETWRKALFAPKDAPKDGNCLYVSDKVRYALDAIAYLSGNIDGRYAFIPLTDKQREAIDALYEDLHSREPFDEANLFKPGSYKPKDLPTKHNHMTELEKAAGPLRTYLKAHGDPHTSVIVTQDERRVTFRDCLNQAVCKAGERYDLKALKPQTSFSADAVQLNDKTGYFWESDNGVYTLRWREHPGEGAKRICKIHWDAVAHSFFITSLHDDGIRLIEDGFYQMAAESPRL